MTSLRVELFGVDANSGVLDADGCEWKVTALDGWESPRQDSPRAMVTGRHGETRLNRRFGARTLLVKGWVRGPSNAAVWKAYAKICGSMPGLLGSGPIIVHEPIPKLVTAEQDDAPWATKPSNSFLKYELTLACLDPFKRGLTKREVTIAPGQKASLSNAGDFEAPVNVTTTTAGTVKVRQDTSGAIMRTRISVGAGTVFDAAPNQRRVTSGAGLDIYDAMASPSEWLSVPRESSAPFTNLGTATLVLSAYDTYA